MKNMPFQHNLIIVVERWLEIKDMNLAFFVSTIAAILIVIFYFLPILRDFSNCLLWIYSCILPAIILVILRYQKEDIERQYDIIDIMLLTILLVLLFLPWFFQTYIVWKFIKNRKADHIASLRIEEVISEGVSSKKVMEYFVVLILPFITIGSKTTDTLTMCYVLVILIAIFLRLKLFHFNLPLMLFYDIWEVRLSDGQVYYLISKKNLTLQADSELPREIVTLSDELKIAILHK